MTYAAFNGFISIVEFLHKNGGNVNLQDKLKRTPLHWACRYDQEDMCLTLLRLGAEHEVYDFQD